MPQKCPLFGGSGACHFTIKLKEQVAAWVLDGCVIVSGEDHAMLAIYMYI